MQTGMVLDCFLSLLGPILLVPIMFGEDDPNIRDLICSKKLPIVVIHLIRFIVSMLVLIVLVFCFLWYLKAHNCDFPFVRFFFCVLAGCSFLGGLGIAFYAISNRIAVAYMIPVMYYIVCFGAGKKYLSVFHLFSLMTGNDRDKVYLGIAGVILILCGFLLKSHNRSNGSGKFISHLIPLLKSKKAPNIYE